MVKGSQRAHDSLVRAIRDLLHLHGIPCWRVGQKASQRRDGTYYSGHDKGAPDIFGIARNLHDYPDGTAILIEAKSGAAKMTVEQVSAKARCEYAGGVWITARSVDDVVKALGL